MLENRNHLQKPSFIAQKTEKSSCERGPPDSTMRASVFCCALLYAAASAVRPSFVFILADDWGWGDVGAYGATGDFTLTGTNTRTPTLDALAGNGTMLTDFHAHALCSPSRAAWLTGRYAEDMSFNGIINVAAAGWQTNPAHGFPFQLPTPAGGAPSPWEGGLLNVATLMQRNGWRTAHYGKWHVGGCSPPGNHTPPPSEYGFDRTATHASAVEAGCALSTAADLSLGKHNQELFPDKQWWSADIDSVAKDLAIKFIRNATEAGEPFYVQLWLHMSHATIDPRPAQYAGMYPFNLTCQDTRSAAFAAANPGGAGIPGEPCNAQAYFGAQHWTDTEVIQPLIATLDDLRLRDNTYVIFSTDNGPAGAGIEGYAQPGPAGGGSIAMGSAGVTGPFRGSKLSLYEGGHRVPFIITGPNIACGRVDHSLASNVDWLPTLAALAGVAIPPLTRGLRGADLSPVLLQQRKPFSRPPVFWRGGGGSPPCWNRSPPVAMRDGDWKLLFAPGRTSPAVPTRVELYNVSVQALAEQGGSYLESTNEAKYEPDVVATMMAAALAWHGSTPCPFGHHNNSRKGSCTWTEIAFPGCESYPFPGKPTRSCRGKPCPTPGTPGPCVCPPQEDPDPVFAAYLALRVK